MDSGEIPIEPGYSWFSPKVLPEIALGLALCIFTGGKALNSLGAERLPKLIKLRIPGKESIGVRLREISLVVKRETAQTHS